MVVSFSFRELIKPSESNIVVAITLRAATECQAVLPVAGCSVIVKDTADYEHASGHYLRAGLPEQEAEGREKKPLAKSGRKFEK